ncbi:MAG: hypothetical protein ACJ8IQ_02685, partial [Chthoniobacterales bacterium]
TGTRSAPIATALAVFVALFWEPLRKWWNAPRLKIDYRSRYTHLRLEMHAPHDTRTFLFRTFRLLITNLGTQAAEHVEVLITDLFEILEAEGRRWRMIDGFVPTPLKWTHSESSLCEYLPGRGGKLCDFGTFLTFEPHRPGRDEDSFTFAMTVQPKTRYDQIGCGLFVIRVVASAANSRAVSLLLTMRVGGPIPLIFNVANRRIRRQIRRIDRLEPSLAGPGLFRRAFAAIRRPFAALRRKFGETRRRLSLRAERFWARRRFLKEWRARRFPK